MEPTYPAILDRVFLLRRDDVLVLLDISPATLGRWVAKGLFPRPRRIGRGPNYWLASELRKWFIERFPPVVQGSPTPPLWPTIQP